MPAIVYLLIGLALGCVIGWLVALRRGAGIARGDSRLEEELRHNLQQRELELASLRADLDRARMDQASSAARKEAAERLLADQRALHDAARLEAQQAQEKVYGELREAFRALSLDALKATTPEFLRLANETFARFQESARGDLAQRQQAIATLVEPLKQHLETYQQRLQQSEGAQAAALGAVRKHLEALAEHSQHLSSETHQLRRVLSSNQARGRWGEETLRRVVEAAGMSAHCDFSEQTQVGEGKPDLIVRLPGDRCIIVDAKVPELDFLDALEVADAGRRAEALASHAGKLKSTIKALADRDYPRQFPKALDYVVLFMPAESLFSAALEGDRDLIIWAAERRILLATPASLIALLRSVSVSWQQQAQTENARAIAEAASELFARVARFTEHFEGIRKGLERANAAYNEAIGSYERMVRPSGERLQRLGGASEARNLAAIPPVEQTLRLPEHS